MASYSVSASGNTITATASDLGHSGGTATFSCYNGSSADYLVDEETTTFSGTSVSYSYSGDYSTKYYVICSISFNDGATYSNVGSDTTDGPPSPPSTPQFTVTATTNSVTITVTNDTGASYFRYFIRLATETGATEEQSTATSHTFSGLEPNTEYAVNVFAANDDGTAQGTTQYITTKLVSPIYIHNGSDWINAEPYIYTSGTWVKCTPYIYDGSSWQEGG